MYESGYRLGVVFACFDLVGTKHSTWFVNQSYHFRYMLGYKRVCITLKIFKEMAWKFILSKNYALFKTILWYYYHYYKFISTTRKTHKDVID